MFFKKITIPGLAIHSYIVGDEEAKECAVIDPVRDIDQYVVISRQKGLEIKHILETHVHADFVSGSRELKARLNGIPIIHCSGLGGKEWIPSYADHVVKEGDSIKMGVLILKAIHTPGHTPEHIMWALYKNDEVKKLFTGDFLFIGDVGRPDLLGDKEMERLSHQLYESVFNKLKPFPDETEVHPAHGAGSLCGKALSPKPSTTLGEQRKNNPSLMQKKEDVWIANLMKEMPPAPKYFPRMKKINVEGPQVFGEKWPGGKAYTPKEFQEVMDQGAIVLDVRSKEAFSGAHIPQSINIPISPQLATWAGWILPADKPLLLVLDDESHFDNVVTALARVGLDDILGHLKGGIFSWEDDAMPLETLQVVTPRELQTLINQDPSHCVLDVRTDPEWNQSHIPNAIHIHGGLVQNHLDQLPKDQSISVICGSGYRASIVASLLMKNGFKKVSNVFGGMHAWNEQMKE